MKFNIFKNLFFVFILLFSSCNNNSDQKYNLWLIGDSTMQDYNVDETPQRGWGQMLPAYFDTSKIQIHNHAIGGRSTKKFKKEGRWERVLEQLKPGDFVFIQFGHNDASVNKPERYTPPDDYKAYLTDYVSEAREKGATPVLITPIVMRRFDEEDNFNDGHGKYPGKMREAAEEKNVLLIDMHRKSMELVSELGPEKSKALYMNLKPGEYSEFPEGKDDNTHMREAGATKMAEIAVKSIKELELEPLVKFIKEDYN